MRLFVALDIDDDTRAQLAAVCELIQRRVREARVPPRVTWVKAAAAHLTLRFIGNVSAETAAAVTSTLDTLRVSPAIVEWGTVGTFGGLRRPRVVWIAPTKGGDEVVLLAKSVNDILDPLLGAGESRPFRPHVTLGRVREPGRDVEWAAALDEVRWRTTRTQITGVTLYESRHSPTGPTYTALSTHG